MKKYLCVFVFLLAFTLVALSQSNPVSLRPDVTITALKPAPHFASGIAFDPISLKLHYTGLNGDIFRMEYPGPLPATDTLLYTWSDHGLTLLKGLVFRDSVVYLIGNNDVNSLYTIGLIVKGELQPGGFRIWSTVMETGTYELSGGAFDHGISGLCFNATGDSIYFNSGSRTDHGEVQENGVFANLRETPINSAIFRIPANSNNLILLNDSFQLAPYLFADGIRNTFKMALNGNGHLIGCENSGDSDDPDELNHLIQGNHYGFPWVMGGNNTKQQYPWYDPSTDFMINQLRTSYTNGYFYNDPLYPQKPSSLILTDAIQNTGPHANKFRDTITGIVKDANDLGISLGTFTTHRSPLGLVFDNDSLLVWDLKGRGFLYSNQKGGDSLGNAPGGGFGTLLEAGEDMLSINLIYNFTNGTYTVETNEIITGFTRPVDACMVGTKIYLLEHGRPSEPGTIYEISMPEDLTALNNHGKNESQLRYFPNPVNNELTIEWEVNTDQDVELTVFNIYGQMVDELVFNKQAAHHKQIVYKTSGLSKGSYVFSVNNHPNQVFRFVKL